MQQYWCYCGLQLRLAVGISLTWSAVIWIFTKGTWFLADASSTLAAAFLLFWVSYIFHVLKLNLQNVCACFGACSLFIYFLSLIYVAGHLL